MARGARHYVTTSGITMKFRGSGVHSPACWVRGCSVTNGRRRFRDSGLFVAGLTLAGGLALLARCWVSSGLNWVPRQIVSAVNQLAVNTLGKANIRGHTLETVAFCAKILTVAVRTDVLVGFGQAAVTPHKFGVMGKQRGRP